MKLKFKRLDPIAKAPLQASTGAAAVDFIATGRRFCRNLSDTLSTIPPALARVGDLVVYNTGIALEIPDGYAGLALARSSVRMKPLVLVNGTGLIDSDYRGEITFTFRILDPVDIEKTSYQVGDRMGQLMLVKHALLGLVEADELSETERGTGGHGSTGK